jgi:ABC-type uncharacterized transport system ATPase subunit
MVFPGVVANDGISFQVQAGEIHALSDIQHPVNYLSGGNLQKLLLGREISQQPRLLIASYPMRGLDVAATVVAGAPAALSVAYHREER